MPWRILPLLALFIALAHFNRISITVAGAEQIIPSGTINAADMGMVYSGFLLIYTLFMIPGGWFIDRFGPHVAGMVVTFGSAALVATTGLAGLFCTDPFLLFGTLLVVRGIMGMLNSPLHPTGARLVANWVPFHGLNRANGLITCAACIGVASTFFVFGSLMDLLGWPRAFLVCGGVTFIFAIVWLIAGADFPAGARIPREPSSPTIRRGPAWRKLLTNRSVLCLSFSYGAQGYFQYLFFYWAEYYFKDVLHLSTDTSRLYSTLITLANGAGMVIGGVLSDYTRRNWGKKLGLMFVPMSGLIAAAAGTVAGLVVSDPLHVMLCFTFAMGSVGLGESVFWTSAVHHGGPHGGGTAAAIMNTVGNGIGIIAPAFTPLISAWLGWQAGIGLAAGACLLAALLWMGVEADASDEPESGQR